MFNQQLNHLRRQFHMTLKTVNPFAILHDLTGAALAVSQHLSLRRQPRHVVMPVTDVQLVAKILKQRVGLACIREPDGKFADLFFRAMAKRCAQRFTDKLRAQTNANHRFTRLYCAADEPHFRLRIKPGALLKRGGR